MVMIQPYPTPPSAPPSSTEWATVIENVTLSEHLKKLGETTDPSSQNTQFNL